MLSGKSVPIPALGNGISIKKIRGNSYVYYNSEFKYDKDKKKTSPQSKSIGRVKENEPDRMYPNDNYRLFFPSEAKLYDEDDVDSDDDFEDFEDFENEDVERTITYTHREWITRVGCFIVINEIVKRLHLDIILKNILGVLFTLFLDIASYMIVNEDNTGWHYPSYGKYHALFREDMRVVSDATVSRLYQNISESASIEFLDEWNKDQDHSHKIYITHDSTNKGCQAGEVDMADFGNAKDDRTKPIINYAIAYDLTNQVPLLYEYYPGCINDVSQLESTINLLKQYHYSKIAFIIDRGYFSWGNIQLMDKNSFDFIIMVKGMRTLVHELVTAVRDTFETITKNYVRKYNVYGTTVKGHLCEKDKKDRYFHIYFDSIDAAFEQKRIHEKIDAALRSCEKKIGKTIKLDKDVTKYINITLDDNGKLQSYSLNEEVIQDEIEHAGYFVLISSEELTALEALTIYKSRDASEKLFRADKSYLGNSSERTHSSVSTTAKMFLSFVALIIRNEMYVMLQKYTELKGVRRDYLTVEGAIDLLDDVSIVRTSEYEYKLSHPLTKKQKQIFAAFGITPTAAKQRALAIGDRLHASALKDPESAIYAGNKHK